MALVAANVRVVPNGKWTDGHDKNWCRMGLVVDPIAYGNTTKTFELSQWPYEIIKRLANLEISINGVPYRGEVQYQIPTKKGRLEVSRTALAQDLENVTSNWLKEASILWKKSFNFLDDKNAFEKLFQALKMEQDPNTSGEKGYAEPMATEPGGPGARPRIGYNSLIEGHDPSILSDAISIIQTAAGLLSLGTNSYISGARLRPGFLDEAALTYHLFCPTQPATTPEFARYLARGDKEHLLIGRGERGLGDDKDQLFWNPEIDGVLKPRIEEFIMDMSDSLRKHQVDQKRITKAILAQLNNQLATIGTGPVKPLGRAKDVFRTDVLSDTLIEEDPDKLKEGLINLFAKAIRSNLVGGKENKTFSAEYMTALLLQEADVAGTRGLGEERVAEYLLASRRSGLRKTVSSHIKDVGSGAREDNMLRKLTAIANYPRLARFLATMVDIDIPDDEIGDGFPKIVAKIDEELVPDFQTRSICRKDRTSFRPASRTEYFLGDKFDKNASQSRDGFLNLSMLRSNGQGKRYALRATEMRASIEAMLRASHEVASSRANGVPDSMIDTTSPQRRTAGISLIDRDQRGSSAIEQEAANFKMLGGEIIDLFAEDLTDGLRLDIGFRDLDHDRQLDGSIDWRSACMRKVALQDSVDAYFSERTDTRDATRPWLRDLDEATIQIPHQIKRSAEKDQKNKDLTQTSIVTNSLVQNYEGWSFGLPTRASVTRLMPGELPVSLYYGHPDSVSRSKSGQRLPNTLVKLKFCREYFMRARLSYIDGSGISWREAYDLYRDKTIKTTIPTTDGHVFRRFETVRPPLILLYEPLDGSEPKERQAMGLKEVSDVEVESVKGLELKDKDAKNNRAQTRNLVLRSFEDRRKTDVQEGTSRSRRVIVPEEVPVNLADMHDVFSRYRGDWPPPGAFPNLRLMKKTGEFPTVDDPKGRLTDFDIGDKRDAECPDKRYTGRTSDQIAIPDRNRPEPDNPYYPDPMAQRLYVAWVPDTAQSNDDMIIESTTFYEDPTNPVPQEALAHLIECKRSDSAGQTKLEVSNEGLPGGKWRGILTRRFELLLPKAVQGKIYLWCAPDDLAYDKAGSSANASTHPCALDIVVEMASWARKEASNASRILGVSVDLENRPQDILKAFRSRFKGQLPPVPNMLPLLTLDAVHAVQKPISPPIILNSNPENQPEFAVVLTTPAPTSETTDPEGRVDFQRYYIANQARSLAQWTSEPDGTQAFVAAKVQFHRASTVRLRGIGRWSDHSDAVAIKYDLGKRLYSFEPEDRSVELFNVDNLERPTKKEENVDDIDIHGSVDAVNIHSPTFKARIARPMKVIVYGYSRYANFFPKEAAEGKPNSFTKTSDEVAYNMPSVVRPDPPIVVGAHLAAKTTLESWFKEKRRAATTYIQRIYLERPWFVTGEGEKLAVILAPWPGHPKHSYWFERRKKTEDLDSPAFDLLESTVTRWGADPTEQSGTLSSLIMPQHLSNAEEILYDQNLPVEINGSKVTTKKVTVALFSPKLEATTGRWYCDINIRSDQSARPFVRFGVARYQANTISFPKKDPNRDLRMSTPVGNIWSQVRPDREIQVERRRAESNENFAITVSGLGYFRKEADWEDLVLTNPANSEDRDQFDLPRMSVQMMESLDERSEGLSVFNEQTGSVVCSDNLCAKLIGWQRSLGGSFTADLVWEFKLELPPNNKVRRPHYLLFYESDTYASDPDPYHTGSGAEHIKRIGSQAATRPAGIVRVDLD